MSIQSDKFASYKLFATALKQKGYKVKVDVASDVPTMVTYTSPSGAAWRTRTAFLQYPFISDEVREVAVHKNRAYDFAKKMGVPIPYTLRINDDTSDEELSRLLVMHRRLIVKPADSLQSRGLTLNINSLGKLKEAIAHAKSISSAVLVQEQVEGEEIRFTVINGKVASALLRRTPRVIGDGSTTIAELIKKENDERRQLKGGYIPYPQLSAAIIDPKLLISREVPARGKVVELNRSTMVRGGCSIYEVLHQVDESYVRTIEEMARRLDASFIVVDLFCKEFDKPATAKNHYFIEFNTAPALKLYYACRDEEHFDIVARLADEVDKWLQGSEY